MATPTNQLNVNFSVEQQQLALGAERRLNDLLPLFDKAEACGVDTSGYRAIREQILSELRAIRENFMNDTKHLHQ